MLICGCEAEALIRCAIEGLVPDSLGWELQVSPLASWTWAVRRYSFTASWRERLLLLLEIVMELWLTPLQALISPERWLRFGSRGSGTSVEK